MKKSDQTECRCPLCGCRFAEGDAAVACRACPLAHGCHMIRCPNCGYEIPIAPSLHSVKAWWKRVVRRRGEISESDAESTRTQETEDSHV